MTTLSTHPDSKRKRDNSPSASGNSKKSQDANNSSVICLSFNKGTRTRASCHRKHACDSCGSKDHGASTRKKGPSIANYNRRFGVRGFKEHVLDNLDLDANLNHVMCHFPCLPAPARPNTPVPFKLVDASKLALSPFSCQSNPVYRPPLSP